MRDTLIAEGLETPMIETGLSSEQKYDRIRDLIGPGGKTIRAIQEETKVEIAVEDDGSVTIAAIDETSGLRAQELIRGLTAEPELGAVYRGRVRRIVDFGAFVNFFGKRDGLVHVSQIENRRLNHPSDVLKEGQEVKVKLLGFDDRGKVCLSMKMVDQETGEEITESDDDKEAKA